MSPSGAMWRGVVRCGVVRVCVTNGRGSWVGEGDAFSTPPHTPLAVPCKAYAVRLPSLGNTCTNRCMDHAKVKWFFWQSIEKASTALPYKVRYLSNSRHRASQYLANTRPTRSCPVRVQNVFEPYTHTANRPRYRSPTTYKQLHFRAPLALQFVRLYGFIPLIQLYQGLLKHKVRYVL